jgi:N-acetylmuramoyl-L-alanine amidase
MRRLVGVVLVGMVAVGIARGALAAPAVLERVELLGSPATAVRLHLSGPTSVAARTLPANGDGPDRIYLDLAGTDIGASTPTAIAVGGTVLRVRSGQFDHATTRVVLDLAHAVPFTVRQSGGTVLIELGPRVLAPPPPLPDNVAAARREPAPTAAAEAPRPSPTVLAAVAPAERPATRTPPAPPVLTPAAPLRKAEVRRTPRAATPSESEPEFDELPLPPEPHPGMAVAAAPVPTESAPAPPATAEAPFVGPVAPPAVADLTEPCPGEDDEVARAEPLAPMPSTAAPFVGPERPTGAGVGSSFPIVVLDAGHGGRDPGAAGVGGVLEKDIVLEVTRRLAAHLSSRLPVTVLMTRTDDSFVPIDRRLAVPGEGAALFVSLHANACTDPSARGLEVFYGGGGGGDVRTVATHSIDPRAAILGRCLDEALRARVGPVRGDARPADFGVLVRNPVPSALVEIGYITHPAEAARTQDAQFQELLVDALADGVAEYLRASAPHL